MEYDRQDIWVSRIIEGVHSRFGLNPLFGNILTVGGVPLVLTFLYFSVAQSSPSLIFRITHGLFTVMLSGIGYLVWYYDTRLLPEFFKSVGDLLEDGNRFDEIVDEFNKLFAFGYWKTFVFWIPLFPTAFFGNIHYFQQQGMGGPEHVSFYVFFAFTVYSGVLTGVGIHLIINTLICVGTISREEFTIDPFHPDGLGGMSAIGRLSIWTMGLAAIGSLGMPYTLQIAASGQFGAAIYVAFVIYFVSLVGIFVYPVLKSSQKAEAKREAKLEEIRSEIADLESELGNIEQTSGGKQTTATVQNLELRHQRFRNKYEKYSSVPLYPLSLGIVLRFAGSVVLPLLFILLEFYISNTLS
jgi:hypothetical protein